MPIQLGQELQIPLVLITSLGFVGSLGVSERRSSMESVTHRKDSLVCHRALCLRDQTGL